MRLHLDITDLLEFLCTAEVLHGVQNVTHQLIVELRNVPDARLIGYHPIYGRPFSLARGALPETAIADLRAFRAFFGLDRRHPVKASSAIRHRHPGRPLRRGFEYAKSWWRRELRGLRRPAAPFVWHRGIDEFEIAPRDAVVMPGLNIWYPEYNRELGAHVCGRGGRLVLIVHDFGPLTAGEFFPASYRAAFRDWMDSLFPYVDLFIADSEHTRRDLQALHPELEAAARCLVNPLAHQFPPAPATPLRPEVVALAGQDYVLHVGRIEPRKNLATLVRVWGRLTAELGAELPRLVLAGRMNDTTGAFAAAMQEVGEAARHISIITDLSGAELAHLYAHCRFAVYPSFFEGWGLPVGEAASFGKVTAAANAASIPEVIGDLAVYFDPHDADDMLRVLRRLITDRGHLASLEARLTREFHPRSWSDCARALLDAMARPPS